MHCTLPSSLLLFASIASGCATEPSAVGVDTGATHGSTGHDDATDDSSTIVPEPYGPDTTSGTTSDGETSNTGGSASTETTVAPDLPDEPVCGDGVVEGDETCDDANDVPDDGCKACARDSIIFITSELYRGSEIARDNYDALEMSTIYCRHLAAVAGLPRFETYRAWLSTQTVAAKDRLIHSKGRYVLVNGLVVANDWEELTSGVLQYAIEVDENSLTNHTAVWTGSLPDGSIAPGSTQCDDWTDDTLGQKGAFGDSPSLGAWWSFVDYESCIGEAALYCIEQ